MNKRSKIVEHISIYVFIINIIKPFKWFIVAQLMVGVVWAVDVSLRPYLIKVILNTVAAVTPSKAFQSLLVPTSLYIVMAVISAVIFRFHEWIALRVYPILKQQIGIILMDRMMSHSQSFYQDHFSGTITNKVNDITIGIPNILDIMDRLFGHTLALCIAIYTMWLVDIKFALGLMLWITIFFIVSLTLSSKAEILSKKAAESYSVIIGNIVDILMNISSIRFFVGRQFEKNNLRRLYNNFVMTERSRDWFFIKIYAFQESSFVIFEFICFWLLIVGVQNQTMTTGDFALIMILNISIIECLHVLSRDVREFAKSFGNIKQGFDLLQKNLEIEDKINAKDILITNGEICFKNVRFNYNHSSSIFYNKSVTIHSGQKLGLVGYSGAGKSTFVHLILRLFEITQGEILIDNQNIKDVSQESLRQAIGIIPQDLSLFNRTLMENIRYGKMDASDAEVIEAAKRSHAHEFISNLSEGYDTLVGERGMKLSGGERQRIAIARAILKNAPVLILDEATSQLDVLTEHMIQESLHSLMQGKTAIVIAHRMSTLLYMDRILVFDKGKVVQDGKHTDLIASEGLYKTLWNTQIDGFLPTKAIIYDG